MANKLTSSQDLQKIMDELKAVAHIDPLNIADVALEACGHIMDHFKIPEPDVFNQDYCFMIYNAYIGRSKHDPSQSTAAIGMYKAGKDTAGASVLAEMMRLDPEVRDLIFRAVHEFALIVTRKA